MFVFCSVQVTMCDLERTELGNKLTPKRNSWLKKIKGVFGLKCFGVTVLNFTGSPKIFWMLRYYSASTPQPNATGRKFGLCFRQTEYNEFNKSFCISLALNSKSMLSFGFKTQEFGIRI